MSERRDSVGTAQEPLRGRAGVLATARGDSRQARRSPSPHSHKFLGVTAALIGLAVGALIVALVLALDTTRSTPGAAWSQWSPPDRGIAGEREIAATVSPFYRAAPAVQLAVVTVHNVTAASSSSSSASGPQIALKDPGTGSLSMLGGTTAVYNLCGLGTSCAIAAGTPSLAGELLLRREALELALYTFQYIHGVDSVVAILPPGPATAMATLTPAPPVAGHATPSAKTTAMAIVLQRAALSRELSQPLRATLPEQLPPTVTQMSAAPEAELISVLTGQTLFKQRMLQAQDGSQVLVLDPLPPQ
jgi:hypothetical protein